MSIFPKVFFLIYSKCGGAITTLMKKSCLSNIYSVFPKRHNLGMSQLFLLLLVLLHFEITRWCKLMTCLRLHCFIQHTIWQASKMMLNRLTHCSRDFPSIKITAWHAMNLRDCCYRTGYRGLNVNRYMKGRKQSTRLHLPLINVRALKDHQWKWTNSDGGW